MSFTSHAQNVLKFHIFVWIGKLRDLINSKKLNNKFFNASLLKEIRKDDVQRGDVIMKV